MPTIVILISAPLSPGYSVDRAEPKLKENQMFKSHQNDHFKAIILPSTMATDWMGKATCSWLCTCVYLYNRPHIDYKRYIIDIHKPMPWERIFQRRTIWRSCSTVSQNFSGCGWTLLGLIQMDWDGWTDYFIDPFSAGTDFRQILTIKNDPRAKRIKQIIMAVYS